MTPSPAAASGDRLREALVDWVDGLSDWSVFFTGTFEGEFSEPAAQRAFERFAKKELKGIEWFYVTERNPSRHGHHVHALLGGCPGLRRTDVWQKWFKRFGRARVEPVRNREDVSAYCMKHVASHYLLKDGGWFNCWVRPNRRRHPTPAL